MPKKRNIIDKKSFKMSRGKCILCGEKKYELLDTHRIVPGAEGGRYTSENSVCLCSNCHRLVHAGDIVIHRYYTSTYGTVLHVTINGEDKFLK